MEERSQMHRPASYMVMAVVLAMTGCLLLVEPPTIVEESDPDLQLSADDDDGTWGQCDYLADCCPDIPADSAEDNCWEQVAYGANCDMALCNIASYYSICITGACAVGCAIPEC